MIVNKQIFFIHFPNNSKFKISPSPLRHTLWQTFKVCQSFSGTFPPKPHTSHKSHQFKILLTEPSAKDERRITHSPKSQQSPRWRKLVARAQFKIQNSKFKIPPSPQFKILLKALIIKHYFVPLPPAKAVIVFGTIYAILLWQALCPKESAAQVIFIKHTF